MIESEGRTPSVAPDQPKPELPLWVEWLVKLWSFLIRARRGLLLIGGMSYEVALRRVGPAPVADPYPGMGRDAARRYEASVDQVLSLPATHGLQLLHGDDLDDVVEHLVAFGAANALVTAEAGGWAVTSHRVDELAETVAPARVEAAHRWLDERRIEIVRRAR
ncbi:hypothetical protein [Pseudonocardia sp. TMWB2A]|uniref:hypothetical protein n=1 Tax=Pseudonocardia sp. TMWB2A TaxID=687430 RepID=UPI00307D0567